MLTDVLLKPDSLPEITLDQLKQFGPRGLYDLETARVVVSEIGPFGTKLAVVLPHSDYLELCQIISAAEHVARQASEKLLSLLFKLESVATQPEGSAGK